MAATSLALTTVLFMPGAFAAAIQSEGLERCDFDSAPTPSPSAASDTAKRQSSSDLDATLENIFGRPPADGDQKLGADDPESISGKPPSAGDEQNPSPDALESIFGKPPPAGSEQQPSAEDLENIFGKPPASSELQLSPEDLESIFGKPPPASNDDGRVLSVGVYMHIVGKPGSNESAEFFLSVCSTKTIHGNVHLLRHL